MANQTNHKYRKYIVSIAGKKPYIIKFYLDFVGDILRFFYAIYIVKSTNDLDLHLNNLDQSFRNNPESDVIFNKLSKDLKFSHNLSSIDMSMVLENMNSEISKSIMTNNIVNIKLPPETKLNYEKEKAIMLRNFINFYVNNYDNIKLDLASSKNSNTTTQKTVIDENTSSKIFNKLIEMSYNNITSFVILKLLNFNNNPIDIIVSSNDANASEENYKEFNLVKISKLYSNDLMFNTDLNLIVNSYHDNNIDNKNFSEIINALVNGVIYLLGLVKEDTNFIISKWEYYLYINYSLILIFVYFLVYNKTTNKGNILKVINHIFSKYYIRFEYIDIINTKLNHKIDLNIINKLSSKYNYLLMIDKNNFINSIFREYDNNTSNQAHDIKQLINISKTSIFEPDILNENYKHYKSIVDGKNVIIRDIDSRLKKLVDIINKIISNMKIEMIKMQPSILLIYEEFILKYLLKHNIELSVDELFFMMYDIILPYLKDNYKVDKFIDYFH